MPNQKRSSDGRNPRSLTRWINRLALFRVSPAKLLLIGYSSYIILGWILLSLPFSQAVSVSALDNLFIAASAVSTTGLVTVDPGTT